MQSWNKIVLLRFPRLSQHLVVCAGVPRGRPAAVRRQGAGVLGAALRGAAAALRAVQSRVAAGRGGLRGDPLDDARETVQAGNDRVFAFGIYEENDKRKRIILMNS